MTSPNWTGRAARTLSECRFTDDANPFERSDRRTDYGAAWWTAVVVIALVGAMLIVHVGAP
jgi:hypothetical protein